MILASYYKGEITRETGFQSPLSFLVWMFKCVSEKIRTNIEKSIEKYEKIADILHISG